MSAAEDRPAVPAAKETSRGLWPRRWFKRAPVVAVMRLTGVIGASTPLRPGLTLARVAGPLQRAFSVKHAKAVAIVVNSPGGTPVQSRLIFQRIRALAEEKELPVYVFCEDVAASGGYMLALAGDEIYADPSSIIGSIGVLSAGFGFDKAIEKLGVERRVYTSGKNKLGLDPFQPEKPEDVERLKAIQADVHETFKQMVRSRRAGKLKAEDEVLFDGEFWSGEAALKLGLIDALGDMRAVMREKFGEEVKLKLFSAERGWLRRKLAGTGPAAPDSAPLALPAGWADELVSTLEARALWGRYGL